MRKLQKLQLKGSWYYYLQELTLLSILGASEQVKVMYVIINMFMVSRLVFCEAFLPISSQLMGKSPSTPLRRYIANCAEATSPTHRDNASGQFYILVYSKIKTLKIDGPPRKQRSRSRVIEYPSEHRMVSVYLEMPTFSIVSPFFYSPNCNKALLFCYSISFFSIL